MSNQRETYIQSTPNYVQVTGKFCFPAPVAPGGFILTDSSKPRPLIIGTDITIVDASGFFQIDSTTGDHFLNWGVNVGDKIIFNTPSVAGDYTVSEVVSDTRILVVGPAVNLASGSIYFAGKPQPVQGTDTNFRRAKPGDYLVVMSDSLTPTVQVARINEIIDPENLTVQGGFLGDITDLPFMICNNKLLGVSINCGGAGVVNGADVATNDILTFYQDTGLEPVYGDSGANTFKILTQK